MDKTRQVIIVTLPSLLLLLGCQATLPTVQPFDVSAPSIFAPMEFVWNDSRQKEPQNAFFVDSVFPIVAGTIAADTIVPKIRAASGTILGDTRRKLLHSCL